MPLSPRNFLIGAVLAFAMSGGSLPATAGMLWAPKPVKATQSDETKSAESESKEVRNVKLPPELLDPGIDRTVLQIRLIPLTRDELAALAEKWLSIVKAASTQAAKTQVEIYKSEGAAQETARQRALALADRRRALFDKFAMIIDALDMKGGDETTVGKLRKYREAVLTESVRSADIKTVLRRITGWLASPQGGIALGIKIVIFIVAIYVLILFARLSRGYVSRRFIRVPNVSRLLAAFMGTVAYWVVLSFGLMMVLAWLGVNVTPMFALVGGVSFILGFAMQDSLGNLANGLMIMISRPFDEGDIVDIGGMFGKVEAVNIMATTISTPDNQVIVIPNKEVWGNCITNLTARDLRRVDLVFGIGYDDDIGEAIRIMKEAVAAHLLALDDPEPVFAVGELADSSVNLICRPWVKTGDYWQVHWDLTRDIKARFDVAGISIPFPQRDIHLHTPVQPSAEVSGTSAEAAVPDGPSAQHT